MHYSLTADERDLQAGLRAFLADLVPPEAYEKICETDFGFDRQTWRALAAEGWLDLVPISDETGSSAWPISGVIMAEEFGRKPVPSPVELVAGFVLPTLRRLAPGALGRTLEGIESGDLVASHLGDLTRRLISTPGDDQLAVRGRSTSDGLVLDGHLGAVQFGSDAAVLVLPVSTDTGWVLARVDLGASGAHVIPVRTVDPGRMSADVVLDAVTVAEVDLARIGAEGGSIDDILTDSLLSYLLFLDGKAVGASMLLLERTVAYVLERQQFGVPIGSFQAVKHKVADIATLIESSRSLATYTAWLVSQDADDRIEAVLSSRLHCADAYRRVCELAIQCHGGMGFTWEVGLHVWYSSATYDAAVAGITLDDLACVIGRAS